jgi:hypothetical protein
MMGFVEGNDSIRGDDSETDEIGENEMDIQNAYMFHKKQLLAPPKLIMDKELLLLTRHR